MPKTRPIEKGFFGFNFSEKNNDVIGKINPSNNFKFPLTKLV